MHCFDIVPVGILLPIKADLKHARPALSTLQEVFGLGVVGNTVENIVVQTVVDLIVCRSGQIRVF